MQLEKALGLSSEKDSVAYQQPVPVRPQWGQWRKATLTGERFRGKMVLLDGTEGRRGSQWQADSGLGFLLLSSCSPLSKRVAVKRSHFVPICFYW